MPIGGIKTSLTIELTILPNAAPMIIPIAISSTLPFMANSLNSFSIEPPHENGDDAGRQPRWYGGKQVIDGVVSPGPLFAFALFAGILIGPFAQIKEAQGAAM